jgi:hypothetical protein
MQQRTWLKILPLTATHWTGPRQGALTVAGQWRNLTAFPSILAIAVVELHCFKLEAASISWKRFP